MEKEEDSKIKKAFQIFFMVAVLIFCLEVYDIPDLYCIKKQDACYLYKRKLFLKPKLVKSFRISKIKSAKINTEKFRTKHSYYKYYYLDLIMYDNSEINLDFNSRTPDFPKTIYNNIFSPVDFHIKGNCFKTLFNKY